MGARPTPLGLGLVPRPRDPVTRFAALEPPGRQRGFSGSSHLNLPPCCPSGEETWAAGAAVPGAHSVRLRTGAHLCLLGVVGTVSPHCSVLGTD